MLINLSVKQLLFCLKGECWVPVPYVNVPTFPKSSCNLQSSCLKQKWLTSECWNLDTQVQGQHELYIKQKQLNPSAIPGIAPAWMVTKCTWKSPWWWTTPSWLWSRERREYSVCSSILPCRSSWVSIPLSPLSSKVRIFRKREKAFTAPRDTQMPPTLSHFWHSHVFNSWYNCSDGCVLATGLSELSTIHAEHTAAASLTWKGGCLQISQVLFSSWSCPIQAQIQGLWESSTAAEASSQGWYGHRSASGSTALPRGSRSSRVRLHWFSPHHPLIAQLLLHKSWRALKVWEPAVCLPSADKSHLSRPFLPNTEQYLAQGSYLNVDLQHKAETDLFSLQQQWLTQVTSAVTSYVCLHQVPVFAGAWVHFHKSKAKKKKKKGSWTQKPFGTMFQLFPGETFIKAHTWPSCLQKS